MKKYDLVELKIDSPYIVHNLHKGTFGLVVEAGNPFSTILFFNSQNMGDYAVLSVNNQDIEVKNEKLPNEILQELVEKLDTILKKSKPYLKEPSVKEFDVVELMIERDGYAKQGVHKGDRGTVVEDYAVDDHVLVDFTVVDENGEIRGDCISVKTSDLKVI